MLCHDTSKMGSTVVYLFIYCLLMHGSVEPGLNQNSCSSSIKKTNIFLSFDAGTGEAKSEVEQWFFLHTPFLSASLGQLWAALFSSSQSCLDNNDYNEVIIIILMVIITMEMIVCISCQSSWWYCSLIHDSSQQSLSLSFPPSLNLLFILHPLSLSLLWRLYLCVC